MKIYPTNWEIYNDDTLELMAEFRVVDEDTIAVSIKDKIMNYRDLIQLSQCLKKAYEQYIESDKKEN